MPSISFSLMESNSDKSSNEFLVIYGTLKFDSTIVDVPSGSLLLIDVDTEERYSVKTDSSGFFLFKLPTKVGRRKFKLLVMADGFSPIKHDVLLPIGLFRVNLNDLVDLDMKPAIEIICTVSLKAINYKSNEFNFDSMGKIELNKLVVVFVESVFVPPPNKPPRISVPWFNNLSFCFAKSCLVKAVMAVSVFIETCGLVNVPFKPIGSATLISSTSFGSKF